VFHRPEGNFYLSHGRFERPIVPMVVGARTVRTRRPLITSLGRGSPHAAKRHSHVPAGVFGRVGRLLPRFIVP